MPLFGSQIRKIHLYWLFAGCLRTADPQILDALVGKSQEVVKNCARHDLTPFLKSLILVLKPTMKLQLNTHLTEVRTVKCFLMWTFFDEVLLPLQVIQCMKSLT